MRRVATLLFGLLLATSGVASAADNDPVLHRFFTAGPSGTVVPDQAAYGAWVRELAMAMAPKLLAPAETLGLNGFLIGSEISIINIDESQGYWEQGLEGQAPPGVLLTTQLRVRKGLPFSVEVGGSTTYLINSELWAFGGEVKWAPNEAVDAFPVDVAVRASLNRTIGSTEIDMTIFGLDFILSRGFGVGGVANIAPYMSYNPTFVTAKSRVLDATPEDGSDASRSNFVLNEESPILHRFVLGSRFNFAYVNFTPEVALTKGLQAFNVTLGLDF